MARPGTTTSSWSTPESPDLIIMSGVMDVLDEIAATFDAVGARGFLHAREVDRGRGEGAEVDLDADHPVSAASVIKIVFAVAFARAVAAGRLDPRQRVEVPAELRLGGSGTAGFADAPLVSLRDLALLMMTVSDNAATDLIYAEVGTAAIVEVLTDLDLNGTHVRSDMTSAHRSVAAELGFPDTSDFDARLAAADPEAVRALAWVDPARANATTPRDMTSLLTAIWNDQAGAPDACAFVRDAMARQENTQRIASGFGDGDGVTTAGKTGTLPFVRNEAGVVTHPDGRQFAVAVFTRSNSLADRNPALDAAIGQAARLAVEGLRRP
jgi:beta-lactamase class A